MGSMAAQLRVQVLVVIAACGGTTPAVNNDLAPNEPVPDHVKDHQHTAPAHADDTSKLYVEITSDGDHEDVLRKGAGAGLATVPYAVAVDEGGDIELHAELASLTPANDSIACKVKIFVLRLPQHDLLGIADGGARASGEADLCLSTIGTTIVRDKLPMLLHRQLDAKK
jgi:hypothetical protein